MGPDEVMTSAERDREASRLIRAYRETGDLALRDRVFWLYQPLARCTLRRIAHPWQEDEDMYQEIVLGIFKAVEGFDPDFGVRFSTYAIAKMRAAALEYVRQQLWGSRVMQDAARRIEKRCTELEQGAPPTIDELMDGGPQMPLFYLAPNSLDEMRSRLDGEEMDARFIDGLADSICVEHDVLQKLMRDDLAENVGVLPDREHQVLREYYWNGKTFREIGTLLQVSESRVFQLHAQAMCRLRARMHRPEADEAVPAYLLGNGRPGHKPPRFRSA